MSGRSNLTQGAVAGLVGAALMAAWFVAIDAATRQPLFTFNFVTQLVFGDDASTALVFAYLLLHFGLFAIVGIAFNYVLESARITPTLPLGAALGLLTFDLAFYAGIVIIGTNIISEVGWPAVLTGNVIAGLGIAGYLRVARGVPLLDVQRALREHRIVREGLVAGFFGAAMVALWFLVIDVAQGRPFFTPAALGAAFLDGVSHINDVQVEPGTVVLYSLLHFGAFALVGLAAARLFAEAERNPPVLLALVLLFVTLEVLSLGVLAAVAMWLFETVPWWTVVVANLIAAGAMGLYLWRKHPVLQQNLLHTQVEETLYHA